MFASNSIPDLSAHRKNEWNVGERERENGRDGFESFASISTKRERNESDAVAKTNLPDSSRTNKSSNCRRKKNNNTIRGKRLLPPSMYVPCFQQNESTDFVPNKQKMRCLQQNRSNGDAEDQISNDVGYHRNGRTDEDNDTDRSVFPPLGLELLRGYPILSVASSG